MASLRRSPESGSVVEELEGMNIREVLFGNFRIFYNYDGKQVNILRVIRGCRLIHPEDFGEIE